jgi:hypothetical protein
MKRALLSCLGTGLVLVVLGLLLGTWTAEPVRASLSAQSSHSARVCTSGDTLASGPNITSTQVYLPFVASNYFHGIIEDFESGTGDWQPFLNYWRLKPEQWYLQPGAGYAESTGLRHSAFLGVVDPERGAHHALYMYLGEDAEEWADFQVEAWLQLEDGERMGLWVRGAYLPDPDAGLHVEGYYITWQPGLSTDSVTLWRIPNSGNYAYNFAAAEAIATGDHLMDLGTWYHLAVQVHGNVIQVFVDGDLVLEQEDDTYSQGTIGFYAYKVNYATWDNVKVILQD